MYLIFLYIILHITLLHIIYYVCIYVSYIFTACPWGYEDRWFYIVPVWAEMGRRNCKDKKCSVSSVENQEFPSTII
jgi:hypothetical protein